MHSKRPRLPMPASILILEDLDYLADCFSRECRGIPEIKVIGCASSVEQATAFCANQVPNILIADVNLPDGDGLEFAVSLRNANPGLRIICVTAEVDEATLERIRNSKIDGYFPKRGKRGVKLADVVSVVAQGEIALEHFAQQYEQYVGSQRSAAVKMLSDREADVLALLAANATMPEAAKLLGISEHTVAHHRAQIRHKLGLTDSKCLSAEAKRLGYLKDHHFQKVQQARIPA